MRFVYAIQGLIVLVTISGLLPAYSSAADGRIDETRYVQLGGIDQFITIHGVSRSNPILLLVHGGPGDVQSPFRAQYQRYEEDFIVVQWDQRGAGKTYGRYKDQTPNLTLDQIVRDGVELTRYLEQHLDQRKIWILGHSWGSVVGVAMVQKDPELYLGYIGTGQVASWRRGVLYQRDFVLKKAREASNQEAVRAIDNIVDFDPSNVQDFLTVNRYLRGYLGAADKRWLDSIGKLTRESMTGPEADDVGGGMNLSGRALFAAEVHEDLFDTARSFGVPVYFIQGEDDLFAPTPVAVEYFNSLKAPDKNLYIIPGAGHFALVTDQAKFLKALVKIIHKPNRTPT